MDIFLEPDNFLEPMLGDLRGLVSDVNEMASDMKKEFNHFPNPFAKIDYDIKDEGDHYELKDEGDHYELILDYNENTDTLNVDVDKKKNIITVSVYMDWKKTNVCAARRYYGSYTMTLPTDCDANSMEQKINGKKAIITFKKVKANNKYNELLISYNELAAELETTKKENERLKKIIENVKKNLN